MLTTTDHRLSKQDLVVYCSALVLQTTMMSALILALAQMFCTIQTVWLLWALCRLISLQHLLNLCQALLCMDSSRLLYSILI